MGASVEQAWICRCPFPEKKGPVVLGRPLQGMRGQLAQRHQHALSGL